MMLKIKKKELERALAREFEFGNVYFAKDEVVKLRLSKRKSPSGGYNIPILFINKDGNYFVEIPDDIAKKLKQSDDLQYWDVEIDIFGKSIVLRLI